MVSNYLSFEYSSRGVESQLNSNYLNSNGIPSYYPVINA